MVHLCCRAASLVQFDARGGVGAAGAGMARLPAGAVLVRRLVLVRVEWPWPPEPDPAARLPAVSPQSALGAHTRGRAGCPAHVRAGHSGARLRAAAAVGRRGCPGLTVRRATAPRWLLDQHRAVPVVGENVHPDGDGLTGAAGVAEPCVLG